MCLAKCNLRDRLGFIEIRRVLAIEQAEAESRMAEALRLEERVHMDEEDSKVLRVVRACVDELTAEGAPLTSRTEQAKQSVDPPWLLVFENCK